MNPLPGHEIMQRDNQLLAEWQNKILENASPCVRQKELPATIVQHSPPSPCSSSAPAPPRTPSASCLAVFGPVKHFKVNTTGYPGRYILSWRKIYGSGFQNLIKVPYGSFILTLRSSRSSSSRSFRASSSLILLEASWCARNSSSYVFGSLRGKSD